MRETGGERQEGDRRETEMRCFAHDASMGLSPRVWGKPVSLMMRPCLVESAHLVAVPRSSVTMAISWMQGAVASVMSSLKPSMGRGGFMPRKGTPDHQPTWRYRTRQEKQHGGVTTRFLRTSGSGFFCFDARSNKGAYVQALRHSIGCIPFIRLVAWHI